MGSLDKALLTGYICRICSKMSKVVVHVHGEEGMKLNLAKKLLIYFDINVFCSDDLPKTVCTNCLRQLKMHIEFLQYVEKARAQFENAEKQKYREEENSVPD